MEGGRIARHDSTGARRCSSGQLRPSRVEYRELRLTYHMYFAESRMYPDKRGVAPQRYRRDLRPHSASDLHLMGIEVVDQTGQVQCATVIVHVGMKGDKVSRHCL